MTHLTEQPFLVLNLFTFIATGSIPYNRRMAAPTGTLKRRQRAQADLLLLLVALIWGTAFVAQRVGALNMGVYLFNGMRFLLGALVLLPFAWRDQRQVVKLTRGDALGIALAGLLLFGGISFQQVGLRYTPASNAGFITGLYVVFIPLILMFGRGDGVRRGVLAASLCAGVGLFLLSTGGQLRLAPGDTLELACAVLWAFHVIWIGRLVQRLDALRIAIGQNLLCGGLSLAIGLLLEGEAWPQGVITWWAIVYTGVFSIGVGYTLQVVGQRVAPAADAAILLSLEAVFAALFGWLLLDERLSMVQLLGCGLMLAGMVLAQVQSLARGSKDERE